MQNNETNVDPAEIAKFSALATRWWDENSEFKPLHNINPLRLDYIDQHAPLAGKKVLDVGCGGGILSEGMAKAGAEVTGIDMAEASLNVAKLHCLESELEIDYQLIPVEELAKQTPASFDTVTCLEMLEHVPDPASIITACAALLKPGGNLFLSTINRNPKSYLFAIVGAEHILKLLPKGTHEHKKFIRPSELAQWSRQAGLESNDIKGMVYNPFTGVYKLSSDVSVNYLIHMKKPN